MEMNEILSNEKLLNMMSHFKIKLWCFTYYTNFKW